MSAADTVESVPTVDWGGAWPIDAPARRDINEDGDAECWLHGVVDCWQSPCAPVSDSSEPPGQP